MLILKPCAIITHEPCQDWKVAALSGPNYVPQVNFKVVTYCVGTLCVIIKKGCIVKKVLVLSSTFLIIINIKFTNEYYINKTINIKYKIYK